MKKEKAKDVKAGGEQRPPHRVRLPGFILDEDVGLGSVIKKVTSTFGVRPCKGCEQRANALNRWLVFTGKRSK
jgi:hypothetical protein